MYKIIYYSLMSLFIFVSFFMILLVLIQKGRGGGLSSAFTGGGGNTAFGSKTGDVLTWITSITFGIFVLLAIIMNVMVVKWNTWGKTTPKNQPASTVEQIDNALKPTETPVEPSSQPSSLPAIPLTPAIVPSTLPSTLPN
jgi:preprotein translocase subunit SecG